MPPRKRGPFDRAILGTYRPPPTPAPEHTLRARSCPSCQSIGRPEGGCLDQWHVESEESEPTVPPSPPEGAVRFVHPVLGPMPGYVVGRCQHRVAESEWVAGFRNCERCPEPKESTDGPD